MSDDRNDETQPVRPAGAVPTTTTAPPTEPVTEGPGRRGLRERLRRLRSSDRDRTFGLAALIASALAGLIIGGVGVAAVHAVSSDGPGDRSGWVQRHGDRRGPGDDGMRGGPRGVPGQLPPTTAPEEDAGSAS